MKDRLLDDILDLDQRLDRVARDLDDAASPAQSPADEPSDTIRPETWDEFIRKHGDDPSFSLPEVRPHDRLFAAVIGLAGGLLDLRPTLDRAMTSEELHQELDRAYKQRAHASAGGEGVLAIDNALGGDVHRTFGPTHDISRLFEAVGGVMRGEFVAVTKGVRVARTAYRPGLGDYAKVEKPAEALVLLLMHWASDFFSKRSLPIPGWSRLVESDNRNLVAWSVSAYRNGANLRTLVNRFLSDLSGLAFIGIALHLYRYVDLFAVERQPFELKLLSLGRDLRFRSMFRDASLVAFGVSGAAAAVAQDPFRLNYGAFIRFWMDARAVEGLLGARLAELDHDIDAIIQSLEVHHRIAVV